MAMLQWDPDQRAMLADKLPDVANVAAGALVFGQLLGERPFSSVMAAAGAVLWVLVFLYALALRKWRIS